MIRVLVVDDHAIVRQGLERLFATADDIELVGMAADGQEAVALVAAHSPDVVLMDLSMPVMDGVAATREIAAMAPQVQVVVLTSYGEESRILDALNAGASGYLLKHTDPDDLIDAVRAASHGDAPLDPRAGRVLIEQRRRSPQSGDLTPREVEVLRLVGQGLANKQIARRLGISERTVKAHLTSVFQSVGVTDRVQAALWARSNLPE
ncbi:MAG: response regulator transcription factor [Actinomycetota bacterium]|nr:response regulator transcription factor [Actinomycetota bacterium]